MKILWQSKSSKVLQAFYEGVVIDGINGGNAYDVQSALALAKDFKVVIDPVTIRKNESVFSYWKRMRSYTPKADLLIMEPYPVVFGKRKSSQLSIAVIHHIDHLLARKSIYHRWYFYNLLRKVKKCNAIVTVSEHWKKYFEEKGCRNVSVIYNSFNPGLYGKSEEDEVSFRQKNGIPVDKKIVYIGNAIREKGVVEVYDALKNSGFHLVMTGPRNRVPELNVQYLNLKRTEYLQLLTFSSVVVCFSLMEEGWNRIAHESLLSHTPVVGKESGGMTELLSNAGQIVVRDKSEIRDAVDKAIANRAQLAETGFKYVRQFDLEYFEKAWKDIIRSVIKEN
ncbi:MAG: glycosyltransferase family 4 protein [Bacteroidota bacterium]